MSLLRCSQNLRYNLMRSQASLKLFQCGVRIMPVPRPEKRVPKSDDYYNERNMEIGRPMSPFISIYQTQLQGVMSIHNRIAGAVWAIQVFTFAVAALVLPEPVDYYVDKINSWNMDPILITSIKCLLAWPIIYHTIDGTRHLLWDFGLVLTNRSVAISGWIVVIASILGTLYASLFV